MFVDPWGLSPVAIQEIIENLGGSFFWYVCRFSGENLATVRLDGQMTTLFEGDSIESHIYNGRWYANQALLFSALAVIVDLGRGWTARIERGVAPNNQRHAHIYNGRQHWAQNEDGSPHDKGNNSGGNPPDRVLQDLKNKKGWDWKQKQDDWASKIRGIPEFEAGAGMRLFFPSGLSAFYPSLSWDLFARWPSRNNMIRLYLEAGRRTSGTPVNNPFFVPVPNPVPIPQIPPVIIPKPLPIPIRIF